MSEATVSGVVHLVEPTKTYGQKGFRKRLVVLEQNDGRFTNYIPVEFIQDNCELADDIHEGDQIEVTYRLSGRKWQRDASSEVKYFLSAQAIRFQKLESANVSDDAPATMDEPPIYEDGDIPF